MLLEERGTGLGPGPFVPGGGNASHAGEDMGRQLNYVSFWAQAFNGL